MIGGVINKKNSYQANVTIMEERFNQKLALLTEQKKRRNLFLLGMEYAQKGVSREDITDEVMLKGYDKQMRLTNESKELVRKR